MSSRDEKLEQKKRLYESKDSYSKYWQHEMQKAPCVSPGFCCFAALCAPCVSYINRVEALHGDMRFYTCCQGTLPCSGRCGEEKCPEMCLCLETFCCFANSVLATRYLLQDEMQIQNTKCDNCLFNTMVGLQGLACICNIAAMFEPALRDAAAIIDAVAEMVYCSVCACMQTQHRNQIKYRNEHPECITPGIQNNPMLAPTPATMQREPNLVFVYPTVNHNGGMAQGVPANQQSMYPTVK